MGRHESSARFSFPVSFVDSYAPLPFNASVLKGSVFAPCNKDHVGTLTVCGTRHNHSGNCNIRADDWTIGRTRVSPSFGWRPRT